MLTDPLAAWFAERLDTDVALEGLDRVSMGHSAETLLVTLVTDADRRDVVIRLRPEPPGLLEPYDLERQYRILRALEPTDVRAPRAYWYEPTGAVLGRDFYVMERLPGDVFERGVPDRIAADLSLVRRMCEGMIDQIAAVHLAPVDLGGGEHYLERELRHWTEEASRVSPAPEIAPLAHALRRSMPPTPRVTLVHGDTKPGNFAFVDGAVSAMFDWEMSMMGDPCADLGWAEVCWRFPGYVNSVPGAPTADELVARWQRTTGLTADHRPWHRSMQALKMGAILLAGGHLYAGGHTTDVRMKEMALGGRPLLQMALRELEAP